MKNVRETKDRILQENRSFRFKYKNILNEIANKKVL